MFLLFSIFAVISNEDYMTPGYRSTSFSDSVKLFKLNYTLDNIFLFDNVNSYTIKVRFLDMTEPSIITPKVNGFAGYFLEEMEISSNENVPHTVQVFTLPKNYCSHNYVSYHSDQHITTRTSWSSLTQDKFQICYLYQYPKISAKLSVKLTSNPSTTAYYVNPNEYRIGQPGTQIPRSTDVEFPLNDGLIVRLQGTQSSTNNFILSSRGMLKGDAKIFDVIPLYFVVSPYGYNFLSEINVELTNLYNNPYSLSVDSIIGVSLSVILFVLVFALTTFFFCQKLKCFGISKQKFF